MSSRLVARGRKGHRGKEKKGNCCFMFVQRRAVISEAIFIVNALMDSAGSMVAGRMDPRLRDCWKIYRVGYAVFAVSAA
jgi:hypothetical protein